MQILAYCLMPNHVHVVAIPERVDSLAKGFGPTHNEYARWVHIRERQTGPHHSEGCGEVVREKTDNLLAVGQAKVCGHNGFSTRFYDLSESGAVCTSQWDEPALGG